MCLSIRFGLLKRRHSRSTEINFRLMRNCNVTVIHIHISKWAGRDEWISSTRRSVLSIVLCLQKNILNTLSLTHTEKKTDKHVGTGTLIRMQHDQSVARHTYMHVQRSIILCVSVYLDGVSQANKRTEKEMVCVRMPTSCACLSVCECSHCS